jgi:hypothetical protein
MVLHNGISLIRNTFLGGNMKENSSTRLGQMRIAWSVIGVCYCIVWIAPFLTDLSGQAFGSAENLANMRDSSQFGWHVIALLGAVSFAYSLEIEKRNWSGIFAGLAFVLMDAFNEMWNGLIFTGTGGYSAYWMCSFPTGYQTLIGWNIEIIFNFLFWGLIITKGIPQDKEMKILGINNRIVIAFSWALLGVIVEIILNSFDALIWNYWWWSTRFPFFLLILAYFPFALITYVVYDLPSTKQQATFVGSMAGGLAVCYIVFIAAGWI